MMPSFTVPMLALACGLAIAPSTALAHKPSESHLTLGAHAGGRIDVEWHIALRDLDSELNLDTDEDGRLSWREVRTRWPELVGYAQPHLVLRMGGQPCPAADSDKPMPALATHTDGRHAVMRWRHQCPIDVPAVLSIDYKLFALSDPTHRGITRVRADAASGAMADKGIVVLGGDRPAYRVELGQAFHGAGILHAETPAGASPRADTGSAARVSTASASTPSASTISEDQPPPSSPAWSTLRHFAHEGIVHIASGVDHVLFLASLLLVAVWRRSTAPSASRRPMQGWTPQPGWRATLREVCLLVTSFTVAHSITLGLAAQGVLSPPSRWVESLIAASVAVAVLDNLYPILRGPRWAIVFLFGLVHGFGFAGALQDLGLDGGRLAWPLLGFNLGVEAGQLLIVAALLPPAYLLRRTQVYRYGVVLPASLCIAALACIWLAERAGDVVILG